ncbi:MAG: hypothetical protein IPM22_13755 [Betaproteobacteria bacterium]|nr:hypothetical protein [Betaproteobacteria bacterium]MCC7219075.1 hypothetical protein [Burkholderiales bacterium]
MIEWLAARLVAQPAHILGVAAVIAAMWAAGRATVLRDAPKANVLWVPALLWLAYAGWEWLVVTQTPDANIRVDLLVIWPVVGLATAWALWRAAKGLRRRVRDGD